MEYEEIDKQFDHEDEIWQSINEFEHNNFIHKFTFLETLSLPF